MACARRLKPYSPIFPTTKACAHLPPSGATWASAACSASTPKQVALAKILLQPAPEDAAFAEKVLAQAEHGRGVFQVDGKMVDAPVIARAKKLLGRG